MGRAKIVIAKIGKHSLKPCDSGSVLTELVAPCFPACEEANQHEDMGSPIC